MVYVRDNTLGQVATRSPACAAAERATRPGDVASAALIKLLKLPVAAHQHAEQARRANQLRELIDRLDRAQACRLGSRLNDGADPLARFLDCELSTPLRSELRARLARSCPPLPRDPVPEYRPPQVPAPVPVRPPTRPWSWAPTRPPGPWTQPPRRPPPDWWTPVWPRLIPVPDLLEHARRILGALRAAGTAGAVVTGLAATITEVASLLGLFGGAGLTGYLVFDAVTGTLSLSPLPTDVDVHLTVVRRRAQALARPEWNQLQQAMQRMQRALEPLAQRLPTAPRVIAQPVRGPGEGSPPSGDDDGGQPRRRRTVTGFHGANGDAILGILRSGTMQPASGVIWLNLGDHRDSYLHGGDRKRRASFVVEVRVTFDPTMVQEERTSTPQIPHTLILRAGTPLATTVTRVFRRSRSGPGMVEDVLVGATAIEAALR